MSNATELDVGDGLGGGGAAAEASAEGSRGRRIAFRVVSVLTGLFLLAMFSIPLLEVVFMWLPAATLAEMFAEEGESVAELELHRSHFMSVGIVAWAVVPAVLVQWRKPARRVAPMLQLVVIAVMATVLYGLSGTFAESLLEEGLVLAPVLLLAFLHPRARSLLRRPMFDRTMVSLAAIATIPWVVSAIADARLQLANAAGDIHAEPEHWATAALMALAITACAFIGASDHDGWRLPAWIAALGSAMYGAHSLAFPDAVSAAPVVWAVAAVVWGVVFAVATVRRSRAQRSDAQQSRAERPSLQ